MRNRIIFGILNLIPTLLTLAILTAFAYTGYIEQQNQLPEPDSFFKPFHAYTLDQYNKHIDRAQNLPSNFVSMDMLSDIGSFSCFYHNQHYGYTSYDYELTLENNYTITLYISHKPREFYLYESLGASDIGKNMLSLNSSKSGIFTSNNLVYRYINGHLHCIEWTANNIWYDLCFPNDFSSYPPFSPDSIIGKLTSKSSAQQRDALHQLPDAIGNVGLPLTVLHTINQILPYIPPVIGLAVAVFIGFFLVPRHRKEHDYPKYYANNFRNL